MFMFLPLDETWSVVAILLQYTMYSVMIMMQLERVVKRKQTATVTAMREPVSFKVLAVGGMCVLSRVGGAPVGRLVTPVGSVEGEGD